MKESNASSGLDDVNMAPLAPVLRHVGSTVFISLVENVAPDSVAAVHFYSSSGGKQFYDANSGSIFDSGKTGKVISIGRDDDPYTSFQVDNLAAGIVYTATVAYRGATDFEWGAESPASAPFKILPPVTPQAPRLEPVSKRSIRVHFATPLNCGNVDIIFSDGKSEQRVMPNFKLGSLEGDGSRFRQISTCGSLGPDITVTGLSNQLTYRVGLEAHNGCWGPRGPWSKPLKLADHAPEPPCAPFVDAGSITENSVRVYFTLLSDCSYGCLKLARGPQPFQRFDNSTGALVDSYPTGALIRDVHPTASAGKKGIVICSLEPDTTYQVKVFAYNGFGFSAPSPVSTFRTLPEDVVEITGTRTQAERDAELRKRALDVDADDPPPAEKRAKTSATPSNVAAVKRALERAVSNVPEQAQRSSSSDSSDSSDSSESKSESDSSDSDSDDEEEEEVKKPAAAEEESSDSSDSDSDSSSSSSSSGSSSSSESS